MKKVFLIVLSLSSLIGCTSLQASGDRYNLDYVREGMTKDQVVEIMRMPAECIQTGREELLFWDGACVSLENNKVVKKATMDPAESKTFQESFHQKEKPSENFVNEVMKINNRAPASVSEQYEEVDEEE